MSIQRLLRHLRNSFLNLGRTLIGSLSRFLKRGLGGLFRVGRGQQAGFVLPTVTMVMLVVSLLTLAMLLRSTDRAKNAQNFRVNEATLNATAPALDRAKAKIVAVFEGDTLPRGTPSDSAFTTEFGDLGSRIENYTFGDEVPLKLAYNIKSDSDSCPNDDSKTGEEDEQAKTARDYKCRETVNTAWKFPVDTDNNGKFDSYTLYTILFRNPTTSGGGFTRARNPLEARNLPMEGASSSACANNTGGGASLVGDSDWFKLPNEQKIKKAFFVYAATVPIGPDANGGLPTGLNANNANDYELFPGGTKGFSALEYQQDWSRIPLANNAVVYQDDLLLLSGTEQRFNGRMITNSNLMVGKQNNKGNTYFYLVSGKNSCFYDEESSKINVGGNVGAAQYNETSDKPPVDEIHLFNGEGNDPNKVKNQFGKNTKTTTSSGGQDVTYNNNAYNQRIAYLVNAAMQLQSNDLSDDLKEEIDGLTTNEKKQFFRNYFRERTRYVPFLEVQPGDNAKFIPDATVTIPVQLDDNPQDGYLDSIGNNTDAKTFFALSHDSETADKTGLKPLRPPHQWMFPVDPSNNATTYVKNKDGSRTLTLDLDQIPATNPREREGKELQIGDRVNVGNNLPLTIYRDGTEGVFISGELIDQEVTGKKWSTASQPINETPGNSTVQRTRDSQVVSLPDLGDTARDGQWEIDAATTPNDKFDNVGGLRVITGAGIYLPGANSNTTAPTADDEEPGKNIIIWPDYFPVAKNHPEVVFDHDNDPTTASVSVDSANNTTRPYLRMRASVVYHHSNSAFADNDYPEDDSGNPTNQTPLACVANYYDPTDTANSNNGTVYSWNDNAFNISLLQYQAALRYPGVVYQDGSKVLGDRLVNPLLASALDKSTSASSTDRTLAEQTAVDAAICATLIMNNGGSVSSDIPEDAIKEVTFLDARQIKANDVHSLEIESSTGTNPVTYTLKQAMDEPYFKKDDIVTIEAYDQTTGKNVPKIVRGIVTEDATSTQIKVSTDASQSVYVNSGGAGIETTETGWITESLSGRYDLPIEERYPLEIRATQIDLDLLRQKRRGTFNDPQEYLLPNSGLIYATREDALPDQTTWVKDGTATFDHNVDNGSEPDLDQSGTDYKLDPTRRPNGIVLINGSQLNRGTTNDYRPEEKGFILATNLPVYIKGDFNLHSAGEEFTDDLTANYSNFYSRTGLNGSFACRKDQPGCTGDGDTWRSATVFSDSLTLLSDNFEFGNRSDADYDLNNNQGDGRSIAKRRKNGFFTNGFVTNRDYPSDGDYTSSTGTKPFSSYFNNFVTPIQRRATFPEYVMEICEKLPVSECEPQDWHIPIDRPAGDQYDLNGDGDTDDTFTFGIDLNGNGDTNDTDISESAIVLDWNGDGDTDDTDISESGIDLNGDGDTNDTDISESAIVLDLNDDGDTNDNDISESDLIISDPNSIEESSLSKLHSYMNLQGKTPLSTSAQLDKTTLSTLLGKTEAEIQRYPRRIAFLRNDKNELILDETTQTPIALGVDSNGFIKYFSYTNTSASAIQDDDGEIELFLSTGLANTILTAFIDQGIVTGSNITPVTGLPTAASDALWFRTTDNSSDPTGSWEYESNKPLAYLNSLTATDEQPLLIPVVQLRWTDRNPGSFNPTNDDIMSNTTSWVQHAQETQFNLVFVAGDSPGRPGEVNGALANFPRFLESWKEVNAKISGSFIQNGRSTYGTAPFWVLLKDDPLEFTYDERTGPFDEVQAYRADNNSGLLPYYDPPNRSWGFDVALLTQAPDLFAQRFAIKDDTPPNEFYREVKRDDKWVQTLLCAAQPDKRVDPTDATKTVTQGGGYEDAPDAYDKDVTIANNAAVSYKYAISEDQRPPACQ
ncbi:hormogonium polysaccharide biosynthesis protein HpsA [Roseofilum sp. BLCC_M154]|uniref:Hormogonium polysaccharide biosynthesis protein HpsA n=1 Tax=Roseofilum acuticapitatum BLCC-M154 TaxID=3022444 RepID=A0ABT7APR3_9CYAN|nr:hormogonium polysaccharide biosynthesis protein HpsA [Roseofilum acuticapitatum]MDJ1168083.1 hormogonium polysaccharide biosynthesis protein HpsA [Roseofilum acuticapitatum BLCC-M154]